MTATRERLSLEERQSKARRQATRLMHHQPSTMCSGWQFTCICPKHRGESEGLLNRYQRALIDEDEHCAQLLEHEIKHQQVALGRQR